MRKLRIFACALCLALLIPLLLHARRILPLDTRPLVAEKYAGWSGVLRLWVFEGWQSGSGSVSGWLNRCTSRFEKRYPGVYVQPRAVDAGAIASLNDSGILPPDMILFPPGLLESPTGLMALESPDNLRPALAKSGTWNGGLYAVPVVIGGYAWARNAALIDGLPDSWRGGDATLAVPAPEAWRRWDAALLALCSGRYGETGTEDAAPGERAAPPGLDLGLAESDAPAPTAASVPDGAGTLPRRLPEGFQFDDDAWRHFINGEVSAMPVTQREVRRLQALSDRGKGPDWRLTPGDAAFSDQLLSLAIIDRKGAEAQQALCAEFLSFLLTDECQGELYTASAFSVTDAASGYGSGDPLAAMDAALRDGSLRVPDSFGTGWKETAGAIVRDFIEDRGEAPELWRHLGDLLGKNTND